MCMKELVYAVLLWYSSTLNCCAIQSSPFSNYLSLKYKFSTVLSSNKYFLYWNFNLKEESISFAVDVNTNGWVGLGLSTSGSMNGADMVIGWIQDSGKAIFEDRYGEGNFEPVIDESQDWSLLKYQKSNGWIMLEFKRDFRTCDDQDLDIEMDTSRIIWSYSNNLPSCNSKQCTLSKHDNRGAVSINLLGGLEDSEANNEQDREYFTVKTDNVLIPNDTNTTYWCELYQLPSHIRETEHYVYKISPIITPHEFQYVHHMVVFICPHPPQANYSGHCKLRSTHTAVRACTVHKVIGTWAVGSMEFSLPKGVAFPIGGPHSSGYLALETHYDNPQFHSGIMDSSGMRFYYSREVPTYKAGILTVGYFITDNMIIPPSPARGYRVTGLCESECTKKHFPHGIKIFGNFFHTHLIGREVILRHYRQSEDCGGWKELPPVDRNKRYDFNLQQLNIIHDEVEVQSGDALELECLYASNRSGVTLGGYGTSEEMCLAFVAYYPDTPLSVCVSQPDTEAYSEFATKYFNAEDRGSVMAKLNSRAISDAFPYFEKIQWRNETVKDLEQSVHNGSIRTSCITTTTDRNSTLNVLSRYPDVKCPLKPVQMKCLPKGSGLASSAFVVLPCCLHFLLSVALVHTKILQQL